MKEHMNLLKWILVFIVLTIPGINIIMILIFAFGNFNKSLKSYAQALIIFALLSIGIGIAFGAYLLNLLKDYVPQLS